jgi:acyl transferase domain-containing protein/NAD(P)-dependent dehydrogenase (short-subunit alcohol dehydrogenase family)
MNDQTEAQDTNDVFAIIGTSCRFPDARNPEEFWRNLCAGHESVREFSDDELRMAGGNPANRALGNFVSRGIVLDGVDQFDASFFGFNPRDAEILDPQQRVFLECAWEALEDAGYDPSRYDKLIGVFGGADLSSYLFNLYSNREIVAAVGPFAITLANDKDHLTTRVAYELNLKGPAVTIQTACSTSLVAVCAACQSLLHYQCDIALAGGSAVWASQGSGYFWEEGGISSPDAHCRAFDADARGAVRGSGAGLVVLKRYDDARADGDQIYALIRGFGLSNDGRDKIGYAAPSVEGQAQAILTAILMAGVDPDTISYVECHGTATPLGDPIEIAALTQAFRSQTDRNQFCGIGSVKTNFGHLNSAGGVAGLIKTVLALRYKMLPPSLNYRRPNPNIDFHNGPFFVVDSLRAWETGAAPRRAGVNSFAIGGTNAHVVLEEAPSVSGCSESREWHLLPLSAKTANALDRMTQNLAGYLQSQPDADLADIAYTLQVGRKAFAHRRVALAARSDWSGAIEALQNEDPARLISNAGANRSSVVFMFPGQEAQHVGMGWALYQSEPSFRAQVDGACSMLRPLLDFDLRDILYSNSHDASPLPTALVQPGLFVTEYAIARLWMDWGVMPQAMVGYGVGEYTAACLAGVFSVLDALNLVAARGRLIQSMPPGAMLAVLLTESEATDFVGNGLSLAAVNGPVHCVLSGAVEAVERLECELTKRSVQHRRLHTSHAFHSAMMDPAVDAFVDQVRQIDLQPPCRPYLSNLTGTWITADQATDPAYWGQHLRQTIRFAQNLRVLQAGPCQAFLEVGPGRSLATLARDCINADELLVVSTLPHPKDQAPPLKIAKHALGTLWAYGVEVDWRAVHRGEKRRRVSLPTYPFERQRYWVSPSHAEPTPAAVTDSPITAGKKDISEWFYAPLWKPASLPNTATPPQPASWLVFCGADAGAAKLINLLEEQGQRVTTVCTTLRPNVPGMRTDHVIDPMQPTAYQHFFRDLQRGNRMPQKIIHWWGDSERKNGFEARPAGGEDPDNKGLAESAEAHVNMALGFFSLLYLAQAIGTVFPSQTVDLTVVTEGSIGISPQDRAAPEGAMLTGACKVIGQELPNVRSRAIDLPADHNTGENNRLLEALCAELASEPNEPIVALRDSGRWILEYVPMRLHPATAARRLRRNGVYVITGGLGGIALTFAQHLATKMKAKLVLIGRSPLPDRAQWKTWIETHAENDAVRRKIRRVQQLEAAGAEVLVETADVTDAPAMKALAKRVRQRFGEVNGVIHSAGIAGGGMIALKTTEQASRVIAVKVRGTQVVHEVFGDGPLDFFVLCSSLNAVLGGFGQIDYCAASCYLDAFAHQNATIDTHLVSVNWDAWAEVGMAVETEAPKGFEARRQHGLATAITEAEGALAFDYVLSGNGSQIAVSTTDLQSRVEKVLHRPSQSVPLDASLEKYPRPKLSTPYLAPRDATEEAVANEWSKLLGLSEPGVNDDFLESGGHSLLAVQLISRLRKLFQTEITIGAFFETPTVAGIAEALRRVEGAPGQVDAIAELRGQMDRMSPEALDEWLQKEERPSSLAETH